MVKRKLFQKALKDNRYLVRARFSILTKYPIYGLNEKQKKAMQNIKNVSKMLNGIAKQMQQIKQVENEKVEIFNNLRQGIREQMRGGTNQPSARFLNKRSKSLESGVSNESHTGSIKDLLKKEDQLKKLNE